MEKADPGRFASPNPSESSPKSRFDITRVQWESVDNSTITKVQLITTENRHACVPSAERRASCIGDGSVGAMRCSGHGDWLRSSAIATGRRNMFSGLAPIGSTGRQSWRRCGFRSIAARPGVKRPNLKINSPIRGGRAAIHVARRCQVGTGKQAL